MLAEIPLGEVTQYKMSRTILGRDIFYVAAYYVDGLLIDTGFPRLAHHFYEAVKHNPIEHIVNTHAHEDHVGANFIFETERKLIAQAHPKAIPLILQPPAKLRLYRDQVWGLPQPSHVEAISSEIRTLRHRFQVLHLPGHSEDHIGLYEPNEGWFFGGDLFLSVKVRVLRQDEDVLAMMASLRQIVDLPMSNFFCGSSCILEKPNATLRMKLDFYENLQQQARDLHARGWPLEKIRDKLLGQEGGMTWISQGEFSKLNLIKGLL